MIALGFTATAILRRRAVRRSATRSEIGVWRDGVAEPALSEKLVAGEPGALASLDHVMRALVVKDPVVRVKLWTLDGRIVYSDERPLVGRALRSSPR